MNKKMDGRTQWINNQLSKYIYLDIRNAIDNRTCKYCSMQELATAMNMGFQNFKNIVYDVKAIRNVNIAFILAYCEAMGKNPGDFINEFCEYLSTVANDGTERV